MCTLSWQWRDDGYELWFSRDESITRPLARPPQWLRAGLALAPIDPQGGGTWLAVNRAGVSFALLNAYELGAGLPQGEGLISRGTVIPSLVHLSTSQGIAQHLQALLGPRYAPFRLCVLWPNGQAEQWCWQGQALQTEQARAPVVSSGQHTQEVKASRAALFDTMKGDLHGFHRSHLPEKGYRSVCMHRPEAQTVSLSQVVVSRVQAQMRYQEGAPCSDGRWHVQTLALDAM